MNSLTLSLVGKYHLKVIGHLTWFKNGFQEFFCIRGAYLLKRFVLSPYEILTGLKRLDIGCMDALEFVLIQVLLFARIVFEFSE